MNTKGLAGVVAWGLLSAGSALAGATTTIDGVTVPVGFAPGGNVLETGAIYESTVSAPGQTLQGVALVTSIIDANGNVVWTNGQNGAELAAAFTYKVAAVVAPGLSTPGVVDFTGGSVNFYVLAAGTNIAGNGGQSADISTVTSGALWLSTVAPPEDASGYTLASTIPPGSESITSFSGGFGGGFLDVTGGAAAFNFATHTFANSYDPANGGFSDLSFTSDFSSGSCGDFTICGSATVKGNAVPEPLTIATFGSGLALLGLARRRRKNHG